jgi:hypothetical protein
VSSLSIDTRVASVYPFGVQGHTVVYNAGPATVYLDDVTTVNSRSLPLPALSSVEWRNGKPLFAVCDTGAATINVDLASLNLNNSRTSFMRRIVVMAEVANGETVSLECASYLSLIISGTCPSASALLTKTFNLYWYDDENNLLSTDRLSFWVEPTQKKFQVTVPIMGARLQIVNDATFPGALAQFTVAGSTRLLAEDIRCQNAVPVYYPANVADGITSYFTDTVILDSWDGSEIYLPSRLKTLDVVIQFTATVAGYVELSAVGYANNLFAAFTFGVGTGLSSEKRIAIPTTVPLYIRPSASPPTFMGPVSLSMAWS